MTSDGVGAAKNGRCLCVFSRILGWGIFGRYIDEWIHARTPELACDYLNYDNDAIRRRVPWYAGLSDTAAAHYRLRRLVRERRLDPRGYRCFLFQGHELAVPFRRLHWDSARIIADSTPAIAARRERDRAGPRALVKRCWLALQNRYVFRPLFARVTSFLVLSEHVKRSLMEDYGVEETRVFNVGPPIYDQIASVGERKKPVRPVLLFVGNDFKRKGGDFLLDLYGRFFADRADLWIVSNGVRRGDLEPGIRLFSDIPHSQVLELMLQSHVFLFPSLHDELGLVLAEAACAGLPIVARESGGQSEYVHDGENGYLLSESQSSTAWRDAIETILADDATMARFSVNSRNLGRKLCARERFDEQLSRFLGQSVPRVKRS